MQRKNHIYKKVSSNKHYWIIKICWFHFWIISMSKSLIISSISFWAFTCSLPSFLRTAKFSQLFYPYLFHMFWVYRNIISLKKWFWGNMRHIIFPYKIFPYWDYNRSATYHLNDWYNAAITARLSLRILQFYNFLVHL